MDKVPQLKHNGRRSESVHGQTKGTNREIQEQLQ